MYPDILCGSHGCGWEMTLRGDAWWRVFSSG